MTWRPLCVLLLGLASMHAEPQRGGAEPRQQPGAGSHPGGPPAGPPQDRWPSPSGPGGGRSGGPPGTVPGDAPASPSKKSLPDQIGTMRRRLQEEGVFGPDRQMLLSLANAYLDRSEQAQRNKKQKFQADRLYAGAAALQQAIEYSQKLAENKSAPTREQANQRLEALYFRIQQADYFLEKSSDESAKPLPDLARRWYQKALQYLNTDPGTSGNYAEAAQQVISALECLAQAAVPLKNPQKKP